MLPVLSPLLFAKDPTGCTPEQKSRILRLGVEALARQAISCSAPRLLLPPLPINLRAPLGINTQFAQLSPSLRSRVKILDHREAIWKAVEAYLAPVRRVALRKATGRKNGVYETEIDQLARDLYLLVLAAKSEAQIYLPISKDICFLNECNKRRTFAGDGEAMARLSVIKGVLGLLVPSEKLPGFVASPENKTFFSERISEILEDAYLNEASAIRRFLSYESNKVSIRRDLRLLLRTIIQVRPWAKTGLSIVDHIAALPSKTAESIGSLIEMFQVPSRSMGPVVLGESADMRATEIFRKGNVQTSTEITRLLMRKGWAVITTTLVNEQAKN